MTTKIVSYDAASDEGSTGSARRSISTDGSHIAFYSAASNLVTGDTSAATDVFLAEPRAYGLLSSRCWPVIERVGTQVFQVFVTTRSPPRRPPRTPALLLVHKSTSDAGFCVSVTLATTSSIAS